MTLGERIQKYRKMKGLSQEELGKLLHISRQTISNWETGKTYPDIVSVVKMSDLYNISLDRLLKEEKSMSNYLNYLEESTNTVKSKNRLSMLILVSTYLGIWAISLISFWFFSSASDAMGYSIMFLWVLLPVTTFIISLLIGMNDYWGKWKWFSAIAFGIMYMLAEYATFSAANMIAFNKINLPHWGMIFAGVIISLVGLGIGSLINLFKSKSKQK